MVIPVSDRSDANRGRHLLSLAGFAGEYRVFLQFGRIQDLLRSIIFRDLLGYLGTVAADYGNLLVSQLSFGLLYSQRFPAYPNLGINSDHGPVLDQLLIRTYAWVLLLRTQGVVNSLLLWMGWIDEPIQMLYTYGAVLLGMVYNFIPFMVLPIYVALEQMDKRLLDAASDLGASRWKAFRHITLPQSKSGIMTGAVLVYVSTSGMFVVTDILGGAKSSMISNIIQQQFLGARNWPFGAALSVIFVITSLVLILLFNRAMQARHQRVGREISEEEESPAAWDSLFPYDGFHLCTDHHDHHLFL